MRAYKFLTAGRSPFTGWSTKDRATRIIARW